MRALEISRQEIEQISALFDIQNGESGVSGELARIAGRYRERLAGLFAEQTKGLLSKKRREELPRGLTESIGSYLADIFERRLDEESVENRIAVIYSLMDAGLNLEEVCSIFSSLFKAVTEAILSEEYGKEKSAQLCTLLNRIQLLELSIVARGFEHEESNRYRRLAQTYRTVLDAMHDGMVVINADTDKIVEVNRRIENMTGLSREELLGSEVFILHPPEFRKIVTRTLAEAKERDFGLIPEIYLLNSKNDEYIPVEDTYSQYRLDEERFIVKVVRDITDRLSSQKKLSRLNRLYRVLSAVNEQIIRTTSKAELYQNICRIIVEEGGFKFAWIAELKNESEVEPVAYSDTSYFYENIKEALEVSGKSDISEVVKQLKRDGYRKCRECISNGSGEEKLTIPIWHDREKIGIPLHSGAEIRAIMKIYTIEADFFGDEEIRLFKEIADDISYAVTTLEHKERVEFLTNFDLLTRLPNRHLFKARLDMAVQSANYKKEVFAAVLVDIDQMRYINDSYGFGFGDKLVMKVARELKTLIRPQDELARFGSDEFSILFFDIKNREQIVELVKEISAISQHPVQIDGAEIYMSISIGVALFPKDSHLPDEIIAAAEAALERAKKQGGNCYVFYSEEMNSEVQSKIRLQNELFKAYENSEFELYYQPQISSGSKKITGAEALIRWNHPERGLVSPGEFIPILEESSLIERVGAWIIEEACRQIKRWSENGINIPISIAINISAKQISRDSSFFEKLLDTVKNSGIDPSLLHLEITESVIMESLPQMERGLALLKEHGILSAIDDFGTGYSSLSYLKRLPVYALKIDRSFISGLPENGEDAAIVDAIIAMAKRLEKETIAEGVESGEQLKFLEQHGCDTIQGYLFAKPMSSGDFEEFFKKYKV